MKALCGILGELFFLQRTVELWEWTSEKECFFFFFLAEVEVQN